MAATTKKEVTPLTPEQEIAALKAQLAEKDQQIATQDGIIADQTEALKAAEAQGAGSLPVVNHDGKQYKVLARKFTLDGETVKAETLKTEAGKAIVAKLIESGSGILKLVK